MLPISICPLFHNTIFDPNNKIYPTVSFPSCTILSRVGAKPVFLFQAYSSSCSQSAHFLGDLECASKNMESGSSGQLKVYKLVSAVHITEMRSTSKQWSVSCQSTRIPEPCLQGLSGV